MEFLENKDFKKLDLLNLIDEIGCLGSEEKRLFRKYLSQLLAQKLKFKYLPDKYSNFHELSMEIIILEIQGV